MTKYLSVILLAIICIGCTNSDTPSPAKSLRMHMSTNPTTLDPRKGRSLYDLNIPRMLFEGLTRIDADGTPILAAAESLNLSKDRKTYTFKLRKAKWSNGDLVTSQDYLHAWKTSLTPSFPSPMANQLYIIKNAEEVKKGKLDESALGISTPDENTLVIELEEPAPYFLELTASAICFPINHKTDLKNPNWSADVGTDFPVNGPFMIKEWVQNDQLVLRKNPLYWDKMTVHLDQVVMLIGGDLQTSVSLFKRKELDWIGSPLSTLPPDSIKSLSKEKYTTFKPIAGTHWYLLNTTIKPFNNKHFRKALAYSIDREGIIEHLLQGRQSPAYGLLPPTIKTSKKSFSKRNAKNAIKELQISLNEMGLSSPKELTPITLTYARNEITQKVAEAIEQQWKKKLGLNIQLEGLEGKTFFNKRGHGDFQICSGNWLGDFNDPENFLNLFENTKNSINTTSWESAAYKNALASARASKDKTKRLKYYTQAEAILIEEMPIIPLYHISTIYAKHSYVRGVTITPTGFIDFSKADIEMR